MKLIAVLIWYDEPTWALVELTASLAAAGCDALVAVDGAYALYPNGRAQSPGEQAQALLAAAQGAGMEISLHLPREVWWGNEIEKRTFAFEAAHGIAKGWDDWLWIVDADDRIQEAQGLREALECCDVDVASLFMDEVNEGTREGVIPVRRFFRAQESGISVVTNHFTYMSGDGQLLFEGYQVPRPELAPCDHLPFVRIDHRGGRSEARNYAKQVYYDRRKEAAAELVPG